MTTHHLRHNVGDAVILKSRGTNPDRPGIVVAQPHPEAGGELFYSIGFGDSVELVRDEELKPAR